VGAITAWVKIGAEVVGVGSWVAVGSTTSVTTDAGAADAIAGAVAAGAEAHPYNTSVSMNNNAVCALADLAIRKVFFGNWQFNKTALQGKVFDLFILRHR
jgi:hypothetical protein